MIHDTGHEPHDWWSPRELDFYKEVTVDDGWLLCPCCKLVPRIWEFDNGSSTICGCRTNIYQRWSIHAESINHIYKRDGNLSNYDPDRLRKYWNRWVETGEVTYDNRGAKGDDV